MKRLLCIMLILVMAFGATAPVYAEAWTSQQANTVTQGVISIISQVANLDIYFQNWATLLGNGNAPAYFHSFQDLYNRIDWALSWIVPDTLHGQTDPTIMDSLIVLTNYAMNHLPSISTIASYVSNWMSNNMTWQSRLGNSLGNMSLWDTWNQIVNAHYALFDKNLDPDIYASWGDDWYHFNWITDNGGYHINAIGWTQGSPLGNIARELQIFNDNIVNTYRYRWVADLKHYSDQLSTWDSQGDSLQQVLFTPESAIQGLYRYLAFVQRDVARMTYIIADPHEQAGMENANESGVADMYAGVYDADNGGVTLSDMSDTFNTQKVAKQTFDTGVSFSTNGLFSFTDDGNWGFWSTAVKNDMDNVPMTRKSESYDSTAYDNQLEELYSIWGIKDDK